MASAAALRWWPRGDAVLDLAGRRGPLWLDDTVRARRTARLPVVLTRDEVCTVIRQLRGVHRLMTILLYGAGLRLLEAARVRGKNVAFACNRITVRARRWPRSLDVLRTNKCRALER